MDGTLINGISVPKKGTTESSFEDTTGRGQPGTQKQVLARTLPHWHSDLRLSASRTPRNKFLCLRSQSVSLWYNVRATQSDVDTVSLHHNEKSKTKNFKVPYKIASKIRKRDTSLKTYSDLSSKNYVMLLR